ncbi:MAG: acetyl esterase/lipase [Gammaproteobacteria bacterium]|jgi:acetyl esterase/lipase
MHSPLDINALLDPEIAEALATLKLDSATLSNETLAQIRANRAAQPFAPVSGRVERNEHKIPGRLAVNVRVHRQKTTSSPSPGQSPGPPPEKLPCIYWMHGGGLVLGTNLRDDARFDHWCQSLNCVGVSVEYGLAPESTYPGPLEDCYAGLAWVHANAEVLGIDINRVGIGGSSAGAGLAAALALLARDRGEIPIAFQALIYPMLDDRQITTSSQWADPVWPAQANRFGWDSYLGGLAGDAVPQYAAAARATNLSGLPPAFISVGALDGFSDEDTEYATRLRHAGVACEFHLYPGAPHGFDSMLPNTRIAQRANRALEQWLAGQLHGARYKDVG